MAVLLYLLIALVTVFVTLLMKALSINQHWKKRGIPGPKPLPFFGNMLPTILGSKSSGQIFKEMYNEYPDEPVIGYYQFLQPRLLIRDVEIIDRIFIKDFAHFPYRAGSSDVLKDPLNSNLFNLNGNLWRAMRTKFAPMFTTGKLRHMLPHIDAVGDNFIDLLSKTKKQMNAIDRIKTYTIDVISTTAFGIEPGPMHDEDNEFRSRGRDVMPPNLWSFLKFQAIFIQPVLSQKLGINFSPSKHVMYFANAVKSVIRHRKETKAVRNDFVQSMITLQEKGEIEVERADQVDEYLGIEDDKGIKIDPTDDLLAGQAFGFLLAGFDATAIGLTMMIYDLATNPTIQEKARQEVKKVLEPEPFKITYDKLKEMTYLDGFVKESLRINSTVPFLLRKCVKEYFIPEIGYTLAPGENITVPSEGIHMDPNFYPDPDNFIPERWAEDPCLQSNRFLPFGYGPRICIGMRLALTEIKALLVKLLLNYNISLDPSMKLPLRRNTVSFFNEPKNDVLLTFDKLHK